MCVWTKGESISFRHFVLALFSAVLPGTLHGLFEPDQLAFDLAAVFVGQIGFAEPDAIEGVDDLRRQFSHCGLRQQGGQSLARLRRQLARRLPQAAVQPQLGPGPLPVVDRIGRLSNAVER